MKGMENTGDRPRPNRKAQLIAAAEALLRENGLAGVTTRAIAEAVSCSEGAIYVHFKDRLELLLAVLQQSLPEMLVPLHGLQSKVGRGTPSGNLAKALHGLMAFHDRVTPMMCSLIAEPQLRGRFRESMEATGKGPHRGIATIAHYIEQEQLLGRVDRNVDAKTAATVLMASSFFHVFTGHLMGSGVKLETRRLIGSVLQVPGNRR